MEEVASELREAEVKECKGGDRVKNEWLLQRHMEEEEKKQSRREEYIYKDTKTDWNSI